MIYQGNKAKLLKYILPFIQNCIDSNNVKCYIEPFVGGANVIDSVKCEERIGTDINDELIALLKYMQSDVKLSIAPKDCSFEHYSEVREDRKNNCGKYSKEYIALIGYFASFGGRYFDGGYGRDSIGGRCIYSERLNYALNQAPKLKNIKFDCKSYDSYNADDFSNCVFYCDPPYRDTKSYDNQSDFDYDKFYDWCRKLSVNNYVFVSEYNMPCDFKCVWGRERKVLQKSDRKQGEIYTEKLFYLGKNKIDSDIFEMF